MGLGVQGVSAEAARVGAMRDPQEALFDLGVELGGRILALMREAEANAPGTGTRMFQECLGSLQFGMGVVCAHGLLGRKDGEAIFDASFGGRASEVREMAHEMGPGALSYWATKLVNDDKLNRLDASMLEQAKQGG